MYIYMGESTIELNFSGQFLVVYVNIQIAGMASSILFLKIKLVFNLLF